MTYISLEHLQYLHNEAVLHWDGAWLLVDSTILWSFLLEQEMALTAKWKPLNLKTILVIVFSVL